MDFKLASILMVLFLLVGSLGGYIIHPDTVEKTITEEVVKEIEVPVNVSVEVPVADASKYLDQAVEDFMDYVDDEELFECGKYEYDFDEISISRLYDSYSVAFDDDEYGPRRYTRNSWGRLAGKPCPAFPP